MTRRLPLIPPEVPNSGLPQHIGQSTHGGFRRALVDHIGAEAVPVSYTHLDVYKRQI